MKHYSIALLAFALASTGCSKKDDDAAAVSSALTVTGTTQGATSLKLEDANEDGEGVGSAASLKMQFYSVWVSENKDCTDAVLLVDNGDSPTEEDLVSEPEIFEVKNLAEATYECIGFEISDVFDWSPDADAAEEYAGCDKDESYTLDIYRADSDDTPWVDKHGDPIVGTGDGVTPSADRVFIWATTGVDEAMEGELGISTNQIVELDGALEVPGESLFIADPSGYVGSNDGTCGLAGVRFGFEKS